MTLRLETAATTYPLTLDEAKKQCEASDFNDDDTYIQSLIYTATNFVEGYTRRSLITQTWQKILDGQFPEVICLERNPVSSITSITYVDTDGTTQTLATSVYDSDLNMEPAEIYLKYNQTWPTCRDQRKSITIEFVTGYGAATAVPNDIKHAMKLLIADWYRVREDIESIQGRAVHRRVPALLDPYRVVTF